jgi:hypothetical protein
VDKNLIPKDFSWGWGFSSVEEPLPGKCKALSLVPSTKKKAKKIQKKKIKTKKKKKNTQGN